MLIFVPKETLSGESRVALVPAAVQKLTDLGAEVSLESGAGLAAGHLDADYAETGSRLMAREEGLRSADLVLRVRPAAPGEAELQKSGSMASGLMDPFGSPELMASFAKAGVSALCSELIPRSTIAQKMDVLSSQANLAGYMSVVLAAETAAAAQRCPGWPVAPARSH